MEELKREQGGGQKRTKIDEPLLPTSQSDRQEDASGISTNLFVGGLPASISEMALARLFAEQGSVARVKILWPRSEDGGSGSGGLSGFVSFMRARDAKRAKDYFDGYILEGHKLRIDWGKPVPLPAKAMIEHQKSAAAAPTRSRSRRSPLAIEVPPPETKRIIDAMVVQVRKYGPEFEQVIKQKQGADPKFRFLVAKHSAEYHYYQSCLDSTYVQGARDAPTSTFVEEDGMGQRDSDDQVLSTDSEEISDQERAEKGTLGRLAQRRLIRLLRQLTTKRSSIAKAMAFAVERIDQLDVIIDIIAASLTNPDAPHEKKIARLYLVSDIINASWRSHAKLRELLPRIFQHFNGIYRSFASRLKAEQFRSRLEPVLRAFENQIVFDQEFVQSLSNTLIASEPADERNIVPGLSVSSAQVAYEEPDEDVDGESMDEDEI